MNSIQIVNAALHPGNAVTKDTKPSVTEMAQPPSKPASFMIVIEASAGKLETVLAQVIRAFRTDCCRIDREVTAFSCSDFARS